VIRNSIINANLPRSGRRRLEYHGKPVHAVAKTRRRRPVIEDVTEMAAAPRDAILAAPGTSCRCQISSGAAREGSTRR